MRASVWRRPSGEIGVGATDVVCSAPGDGAGTDHLTEEPKEWFSRRDGTNDAVFSREGGVGRHVECVVDGGPQVLGADRIVLDVGPDLVGLSVNHTAANAGARDQRGEAVRPMDSARLARRVDAR